MMVVTENDIQILAMLARYYVLTREQIQRLSAPHLISGRSLRRRITKLRQDDYLFKHRVPVALPGKNGAAPVYYLTKKGTEPNGTVIFQFLRTLVYDRDEYFVRSFLSGVGLAF